MAIGSIPASLPFKGQVTEQVNVKWCIRPLRSHGTKLKILVSKLRSETSKTKAGALF